MNNEPRKVMEIDRDYPTKHRTPLYRNLQTLCSKIYLMNSITNHYNENTYSEEHIGLLKPRKIMAGFATRIDSDEASSVSSYTSDLDSASLPTASQPMALSRLESSNVAAIFDKMLIDRIHK